MSDDNNTNDAPKDASGAATQNPDQSAGQAPAEPPYQIIGQYVKDLSFENPNAPAIFAGGSQPKTYLNVDVKSNQMGGRDVEVVLIIEAKAQHEDKIAYLMELSYAAIVRIGNLPKEALNPLLLIEVPRMIFPFARQIASDATRSGGFATLMLPPFDFVQLYRERVGAQQTDGADPAAKPKLDS